MTENVNRQKLTNSTPELAPSSDSGIFGLRSNPDQAKIHIIPVPWEATASYGRGTSTTPGHIIPVSHQLDFLDPSFGTTVAKGIHMEEDSLSPIKRWNNEATQVVQQLRQSVDAGTPWQELVPLAEKVNGYSQLVNRYVEEQASCLIQQEKCVGLLGGDHSSPLGLIKALAQKYKNFAIIHIDAHYDLRQAYEGFTYSHASIMYNVMQEVPEVSLLKQIGIRDYCQEEFDFQQENQKRIQTFFDHDYYRAKLQGESFQNMMSCFLENLPEHIYISLDIDGLNPFYGPHTGTPVPGGIDYHEAIYLFELLRKWDKKVIGFDLCEVAPHPNQVSDWDLNVGARLLYKLCGLVS